MDKWKTYLQAQLKRTIKTFPGILFLTIILTVGMCFLLQLIAKINASQENNQVLQIGIVGDTSDTYLGLGINVIKNMDSIKSMANIQSMTEQEAQKKLQSGEISAYALIPEGFVDSLITGENHPITYVTMAEAQGLGGILINELIASISDMVTISQNAIYAMQVYLLEHDLREQIGGATDELNMTVMKAFLTRTDIYEIHEIGVGNRLSFKAYFFCSAIILFLLLWGINCVSLFVKEDFSFCRLLYRKGYGALGQVLSELAAYFVLMILCICTFFVAALFIKNGLGIQLPEWELLETGGQIMFVLKLLPLILMVSALQVLLYEMVQGIISGVLVQFLCAVCLSYISGCLYPISFFPDVVQKVAYVLPTGVGLRYLQNNLSKQNALGELCGMVMYTILFIALQTMWRRHRIAGK